MQNFYNSFLGPFIFFSLIIFLISAFILPNTKLAKYFRVNEKFFVITNIIGILSGTLGIVAIFSFSPEIVKTYLWKILIMPYVYLQIYTLYVMIAKNTLNIYDEKQDFNMTTGAAITFGAMIVIMTFIITPLITNQILEINLLNPFFLNASILTG